MADVNRTVMIMIKGNADKLNKALSDSKTGFAKFAKGIAVAGAAVSAMALGIAKLNQSIADMINELVDASTKTGIAVETLQALKLAAEGSGKSFNSIESGIIRFQQSMEAASLGTGRQAEAFERLGVKVQTTNGSMRESNDVFNEAIEKLGDMGEGTERNITTMALFGRTAGASLLQSGAIDNMALFNEKIREFGVDVGPKAREEAARWQRAMADLGMVTERAAQDMAGALTGRNSPAAALEKLVGALVFVKSIAKDVLSFIADFIRSAFGSLQAAITTMLSIDFSSLGKKLNDVLMVRSLRDIPKAWAAFDTEIRKQGQVKMKILMEPLDKALNESTANMGSILSRATGQYEKMMSLTKLTSSQKSTKTETDKEKEKDIERSKSASKQKKDLIDLIKLRNEVLAIKSKSEDKTLDKEQRIKKEYAGQIKRLREIQEISKEKINTIQESNQLMMDMEDQLAKVRKENDEKQKKREQEALQRRINNINSYGKAFTGYMSSFASAVKTTMENGGKLTEERAQSIHKLQQRIGVGEVWINAAVATMKAYAQFGLIGGIPAGIAMSALATAQTAAIMSQPPPKFHTGGFVDGADVVNAQLLKGEAVLDRQTVREIGGARGVQKIGQNPQVVVVNSFKHFDRFLAASMRENTRIRNLVPASSGRKR